MWVSSGLRIKQNPYFCINALQSQEECVHCMEICPNHAIEKDGNGKITLQPLACTGCGACLSRCPTEGFTTEDWDEMNLVRRVIESDAPVVELFCGANEKPYIAAKEDMGHGLLRINTCFAAFSKAAWFVMGQKKKLILHQEACENCEIASCRNLWQISLDQTREYLLACGITPQIESCMTTPSGMVLKKRWAQTEGERATSRREILLQARNKGMEMLIPSILRQAAREQVKEPEEKRESLWPLWSRRLGGAYVKAEEVNDTGEAAIWPYITVKDNCISCGVCSYFCPTGALQKREADGKVQTLFNPGRCADCRLCEELCSKKAIVRSRRAVKKPFYPRIVQEISVGVCKKCGMICAKEEDGICNWCKNEQKLRPMFDQVKLAMKRSSGKNGTEPPNSEKLKE